MTPGTEPHLQLIHRAYCYLRLSGIDVTEAMQAISVSFALLTQPGGDTKERREAIWREVERLTAEADEERAPPALPSPPLLRGHMGYAEER